MPEFLLRMLMHKFYSPTDSGGGDPNAGGSGEPNGDGNQPSNDANIEQEVQKRLKEAQESQRAELEKQIRQKIEEESKLTESEKIKKMQAEFAEEMKKAKEAIDKQKVELNVSKVKNIYANAGLNDELVAMLTKNITIDTTVEEKKANDFVNAYNKHIEKIKEDLKKGIQTNQPKQTQSTKNDDDKQKSNDDSRIEKIKNKYFKR